MTDEAFLAEVQRLFPRHVEVGKVTGQVRLRGPAWNYLREHDWNRDGRKCANCSNPVEIKKGSWASVQCAHRRSKGANGSDLPSNTRSLCIYCHTAEHAGKEVA